MDLTNQLLEGGGWEPPTECDLLVQPLLGERPTIVPLENGQRVGFTVDPRPLLRHHDPGPALAALEVDGEAVWRKPGRGGPRVKLRLAGAEHPRIELTWRGGLLVTE